MQTDYERDFSDKDNVSVYSAHSSEYEPPQLPSVWWTIQRGF